MVGRTLAANFGQLTSLESVQDTRPSLVRPNIGQGVPLRPAKGQSSPLDIGAAAGRDSSIPANGHMHAGEGAGTGFLDRLSGEAETR